MRTRVIPAQITTVEDKIAGNFNFAQILLFMVPIFWSALVYVLLPMPMKLTLYKVPLILLVTMLSFVLAIKFKGKIILQWLVILLKYNLRPRYYVFNKNESYMREIDLPIFKQRRNIFHNKKTKVSVAYPNFEISELTKLEQIISDPRISFSFKSDGIGGKLNVAYKQATK